MHFEKITIESDILNKLKYITDRCLANDLVSPTMKSLVRILNSFNGVAVLEGNSGNDVANRGYVSIVYSAGGIDRAISLIDHSLRVMVNHPDLSVSFVMRPLPIDSLFIEFMLQKPQNVPAITLHWNSYEELKLIYSEVLGFGDLENFDDLVQQEQELFCNERHFRLDWMLGRGLFESECFLGCAKLKILNVNVTNESSPIKLFKYWSKIFNSEEKRQVLSREVQFTFKNYVIVETAKGDALYSRSEDCFI